MEMLKPSQSHTVGVIVKPYTGNIAQELQFLTEKKKKKKKKTKPILRLGSPWQPSNNRISLIFAETISLTSRSISLLIKTASCILFQR